MVFKIYVVGVSMYISKKSLIERNAETTVFNKIRGFLTRKQVASCFLVSAHLVFVQKGQQSVLQPLVEKANFIIMTSNNNTNTLIFPHQHSFEAQKSTPDDIYPSHLRTPD